jgi:nicotinamide mononucleotide transporter
LGAAIYGWMVWKYGNKSKEQKELPITRMPKRSWLKASIVFLVAQFIIAGVLINYTDSNVPWWDAFTTALSIIGMWMLARKYLEQWWIWIVVDVVCVGLYIYKELYFTAGLYALYAIIAIFGWLNWKKLMNVCKK